MQTPSQSRSSCECKPGACGPQQQQQQQVELAAPGGGEVDTDDGKDFGRRTNETHSEYLRREYSALKPFVIISLSYLLFTTTDGAVRWGAGLHANMGQRFMRAGVTHASV